jgi:hypothetical protein
MLYLLLGLVLILGGIVLYCLWLFSWRGTRISDIPDVLDVLIRISRRPITLTTSDTSKWLKFALYKNEGQDGVRVLVPCATLDDARIRKLTAALGRGKRAYSFDHKKVLHVDFGTGIDSIYKFSRTVLLDVFDLPETTRYRYQLRETGPWATEEDTGT